MKKLAVTGLIALCASGASYAQQGAVEAAPHSERATTIFSFMGDDTETPTSRKTLNKADCKTDGDKMNCIDASRPTVAGVTLNLLLMNFNKGLLWGVAGDADTEEYPTLLRAFTEKYGQPTVETKEWKSRGGAVLTNNVATWKFKGGEMVLRRLGRSANSLSFMFGSEDNAPPRDKPKVDF